MSKTLALKQAPAETLDLLLARPELAVVFWMNPDYTPPKTPAPLVWIAKLMGHYEPPMDLPEPPSNLARNGEELRLDRSIDNLLRATGDPPITELGQPIPGSDHGFGDERVLRPEQVDDLASSLGGAATRRGSRGEKGDDLDRDFVRLQEFVEITRAESLGLVIQLS